MNKPVYQFSPEAVAETAQFDLLIAACGYESRSTHVARTRANQFRKVISYAYGDTDVLSYSDNKRFFQSKHDFVYAGTIESFKHRLARDLMAQERQGEILRVAVDVSSFDRERLAAIVLALDEFGRRQRLLVAYFYALASFDSHEAGSESAVLVNGPLVGFEGWSRNPSLPVACVIGLGFEDQIALAALETLEPARTIAFVAESADDRFNSRVQMDNAALFMSKEITTLKYDLVSPFHAIHALEDVVHALLPHHRLALVPLGPKLFALLCMLVALEYRDDLSIWRVSAGRAGLPQERVAMGPIVSFQVEVHPA